MKRPEFDRRKLQSMQDPAPSQKALRKLITLRQQQFEAGYEPTGRELAAAQTVAWALLNRKEKRLLGDRKYLFGRGSQAPSIKTRNAR